MLLRIIFLTLNISINCFSQGEMVVQNKDGHYTITVAQGWTQEIDGSTTNVYAPEEGDMDPWSERLEISVTPANDLTVDEAFAFYITTDFPSAYGQFTVIRQGDESINGLKAKWAVFTFSGSGTAAIAGSEGETVSATLQTLFYLIEKDNLLYLLTGITEKSYYATYEHDFLAIIRSFRMNP